MKQAFMPCLLAAVTARAGPPLLQQHHFLPCQVQDHLNDFRLPLWDQIDAQKRILAERLPVGIWRKVPMRYGMKLLEIPGQSAS